MGAAEERLKNERKNWRKDHPPNFVAKPATRADGSSDIFEWEVKVPARPNSVWSPGILAGKLTFTEDYPAKPPVFAFDKINGELIFHPNVYTDGHVCLSIINPEGSTHAYGTGGNWNPTINIEQILRAVQMFLDEPQGLASGRQDCHMLYRDNRPAYDARVKRQVAHLQHVP